ncbi:MAG: Gfo/Idh/MocA family oxidoreductase, partial [Lentisphaeria bacterium]|nr:Gfo/Idh/MocA family oxidoreductase [Lentisphaeria bacterium]
CTSLDDLERIAALVEERGLVLGCQLDLRAIPQLRQARDLIRRGDIGEVHAISFGGQHPYFCYQRADWYLDHKTYGGVINDIGIHGVDIVEWITGMRFTEVTAAREWCAFKLDGTSQFPDAAQFMLKMENGCGVMGDVSFISPASCGFSLPYYWEFTFWGSKGVLRCGLNRDTLDLSVEGEKETLRIPKLQEPQPDYFEFFLRELAGNPGAITTSGILSASRKALKIQRAADEGLRDVVL